MARAASPTPSRSKQWKAFGASWMPAPISPSAAAFSSTTTENPLRARPSAVASPPMPPPATRIGRSAVPSPPAMGEASGRAVLLEPGLQPLPAVLRGLRPVARAVVGVEGVRRLRIDHELAGLVGRRAGLLHLLGGRDRDALVGAAIEAEHRRLELARERDRMLRRRRRR